MKKPLQKAAALKYDQEANNIPVVSASGKGLTAENIIKKAREHEVPVLEDPSLVELLSELDINEAIPEELYQAVAEVFAFIYRADKKLTPTNKQ